MGGAPPGLAEPVDEQGPGADRVRTRERVRQRAARAHGRAPRVPQRATAERGPRLVREPGSGW